MNEPVRTLIVDDEPIARRGIRMELAHDPEVLVIGECQNAAQAIAFIKKDRPDLMFLDIHMPKRDGLTVLDAVGMEYVPAVVFITAYDEYALKAFDANAVDYVLKPIDPNRFRRALRKAKSTVQSHRLQRQAQSSQQETPYLHRIIVRSRRRIEFVDVSDVEWVEAADNYVYLHAGPETFLHRATIKNLTGQFDPQMFIRIRRSTIVNVDFIKHIRRGQNGEHEITLKCGRQLTTSRRCRRNIRSLLENLPSHSHEK